MADADGGDRKWLTCGCVGCLIVLGLIALVISVVFGSAWFGVRSEEVEDRVLTPEILHDDNPGKVVLLRTVYCTCIHRRCGRRGKLPPPNSAAVRAL